jgi:hypothetical protein
MAGREGRGLGISRTGRQKEETQKGNVTRFEVADVDVQTNKQISPNANAVLNATPSSYNAPPKDARMHLIYRTLSLG